MENKFDLYYYANYEFDKTETPKQTLITIDSRGGKKEEVAGFDQEENILPPLETAINSKWVISHNYHSLTIDTFWQFFCFPNSEI